MNYPIAELYRALLRAYGPQGWWPADDPFEMMVGAILIQHTNWRNADKALGNIRAAGLFNPQRMSTLGDARLAELIRPAGLFNVKVRRLKHFLHWYCACGGFDVLRKRPADELRNELLAVNGIGRETADDMLVYAFGRPVFVVDAYARRIFKRFGLISGSEEYEGIRAGVERALPENAARLGEFHALLVAHAKTACRRRPLCEGCCLQRACAQKVAG